MLTLNNEIRFIKLKLYQWFTTDAVVIGAAKIRNYPILKQEHALIANAIFHRQCEFSTGRWLAREGLRKLGFNDEPIRVGRLKNPLWPQSIIGTISHDHELCVVVVLQKKYCLEIGVGVDLFYLPERSYKMPELISMFMTSSDELIIVKGIQDQIYKNITTDINLNTATILFSIKESIIKAMSFKLHDFIDLRAINLIEATTIGTLSFQFEGQKIDASIFAMITGKYLLTAVKVF